MTKYNLPVDYDNLNASERREVRLQYIKEQDGMCWHCKNSLISDPTENIMEKRISMDMFPPGFLNHPVHLQHDHDSGLTEGAVHARCNAVLWQYHGR
jgi:hypothetical protein